MPISAASNVHPFPGSTRIFRGQHTLKAMMLKPTSAMQNMMMRAMTTATVRQRNPIGTQKFAFSSSTLGGFGGAIGGGAMFGMGGSGFGAVQAQLPFDKDAEYDLIVIGGGTGGISCATEAKALGLKVAIFDYVSPSPAGNTWGLGGTCVNVGCIPKKLMHIAAQTEEQHHSAKDFGWSTSSEKSQHDWMTLRNNVQQYIKKINFGYVSKMSELGIDYINAKASFKDASSVKFVYKDPMAAAGDQGTEYDLRAKNFVIAVGGRPRQHPAVPTDCSITSDDLFSMKTDPGETLVLGGGYIAVECAGFLNGLGKKVHLANRSTFLRAMDSDMAAKIVEELEDDGVNTLTQTTVTSVQRLPSGKIQVQLVVKGEEKTLEVDTVLTAIGRDPDPATFGASNAGVNFEERSGKIVGRDNETERTNVDNIYAVGDCVLGVPELMPVAQKSGKLLAHRLSLRKSQVTTEDIILGRYTTDYSCIPTTVFSPTEYSFVGQSEAEAISQYGADGIEVYHREAIPLQLALVQDNTKVAYMKLITTRSSESNEILKGADEKVIGIHYYGPGADEMIGGLAVAMKLGMTKRDLDFTIGVHPSTSEDLYNMDITKRSGADWRKTGC